MPGALRRGAVLLALSLSAWDRPLDAQPPCPSGVDGPPRSVMQFTVRERPGQPPVLVAEGVIDEDVIPRFEAALDTFQGREIWLRSPGGHAGADHRAGMMIRQRGLTTRVPEGWTCRGACVFMFLGGLERLVDEGGSLVVDMFEHLGDLSDLTEVERSSRMLATLDYDFLIRMGVSPRLLTEVVYHQSTRDRRGPPRCLTPAELVEYRVISAPAHRPRSLEAKAAPR
jgi:hypothetical protein